MMRRLARFLGGKDEQIRNFWKTSPGGILIRILSGDPDPGQNLMRIQAEPDPKYQEKDQKNDRQRPKTNNNKDATYTVVCTIFPNVKKTL
jgi:hypothetical protein